MKKNLTYDYIVVGTGPAGSVIAKTLTDDKQISVLVLESGGNHDKDIPIKDSTFALELEESYSPDYFWQGEGVPQEGLDGRSFEWTTGRLTLPKILMPFIQEVLSCRIHPATILKSEPFNFLVLEPMNN